MSHLCPVLITQHHHHPHVDTVLEEDADCCIGFVAGIDCGICAVVAGIDCGICAVCVAKAKVALPTCREASRGGGAKGGDGTVDSIVAGMRGRSNCDTFKPLL